jgi:hypothetical protein
VLGVLLAAFVALPGCLNPRPEEDPSVLPAESEPSADSPTSPGGVDPSRETCEDNGLLAGCEAPGDDLVETPPSASEGEAPASAADAGAPSPADAGDASSASTRSSATTVDAGSALP